MLLLGLARERLQLAEQPVAFDPMRKGPVRIAFPGPEFRQIEPRHYVVLRNQLVGLTQRHLHLLRKERAPARSPSAEANKTRRHSKSGASSSPAASIVSSVCRASAG